MFLLRLQLLNAVKGGEKKKKKSHLRSSVCAAAGKEAKGKAVISDEGYIGQGTLVPAEPGHPTAACSATEDCP